MRFVNKNITNKRKKNFVVKKKFLIFIIIIIIFFFIFLNMKQIIASSKSYVEEYSNIYEYNLENINISNLQYLDENEILYFFKSFKNKSIFLVPIKNITRNIIDKKWVKDIQIISDYKNTLNINIEEEVPFGIYDNQNQQFLFSSELIILEILKKKSIS